MLDRELLTMLLLYAMDRKPIYGRTRMQKLLFLVDRETKAALYRFYPFEYGPFSFDLNDDIRDLTYWGYLNEEPEKFKDKIRYKYTLTEKGEKEIKKILRSSEYKHLHKFYKKIEEIKARYYDYPLPELLREVCCKYPEYARYCVVRFN